MIGLWLIASPYMFGYSGDGLLRFWHTSLGGLVVLLAALQLWQDWDLSDQDLAQHDSAAGLDRKKHASGHGPTGGNRFSAGLAQTGGCSLG